MASTDYLKRRGNTWYVRVQIPPNLWPVAGTREYVRTLKTGDLKEAERRKHAFVAMFKRKIAELRRDRAVPFDGVAEKALSLRDFIAKNGDEVLFVERDPQGKEQPFRLRDELYSQITDKARLLEETHGDEVATTFFKVARGEGTLLREVIEPWLLEQEVSGQTLSQHRVAANAFLNWAGNGVLIEDVTRKKAGAFVSKLLSPESGLKRPTVKRYVSSLSSLWQWLEQRGHVESDENPWLRQGVLKKSKSTLAPKREQWSDTALVKLLTGKYTPKYHTILHDVTRLALVTGARIEELCALKRRDVQQREDGWWITVREGKTDSAVRQVPVHDCAGHILKRRLGDGDEYLFAGLIAGGPDHKRSWYVTKAFGRYTKKLQLGESRQVFHALRNTFTEVMEAAEVPEHLTKLIVGHKRSSLTYGHYSKGRRVKLREQIEKLRYSDAVMRLIQDDSYLPRGGDETSKPKGGENEEAREAV